MGPQHSGQNRDAEGQPKALPVDPDSAAYGEEVRMLLCGTRHGKYRVLFAIRGDSVHILTMRHSAQRSLSEELGHDPEGGDPSIL
jgi:hypothetical protein